MLERTCQELSSEKYQKFVSLYRHYEERLNQDQKRYSELKEEGYEIYRSIGNYLWVVLLIFAIIIGRFYWYGAETTALGLIVSFLLMVYVYVHDTEFFINFRTSGRLRELEKEKKKVEARINESRSLQEEILDKIYLIEKPVCGKLQSLLFEFYKKNLYRKKSGTSNFKNDLEEFKVHIKKVEELNSKLISTNIPLLNYEKYFEERLTAEYKQKSSYDEMSDEIQTPITEWQKQIVPPEILYKNARKIDNWDEINIKRRLTGAKGEEIVLAFEQEYLASLNRKDLSDKVQWVSKDIGDGLGYDIQSFFEDGRSKYIEVKSSTRSLGAPFYLSRNEHNFLKDHFTDYRLYRVTKANDVPELKVYTSTEVLNQHEMIPEQYLVKKKRQ